MEFTSLRTVTLPLVGTRAVRVAASAPYPQRVLLVTSTTLAAAGARVFVTGAVNELNNASAALIAAGAALGGAVELRGGARGTVLTLRPGQALFAATSILGASLSVSVSAVLSFAGTRDPYPTTFRSYTLPASGANSAIRIVPSAELPRRVHVMPGPLVTNVRVAQSAEELNPFGANPPGAFRFDEVDGPLTFVMAPRQAMYATVDPGSAGAFLAVSVSDIYTQPPTKRRRRPSQVHTITLAQPFSPAQVALGINCWRRVLLRGDPDVVVGAAPEDMSIPFVTAPVTFASGAFSFTGVETLALILAPGQPLFAATGTPPSTVQAHISEALFDGGEGALG